MKKIYVLFLVTLVMLCVGCGSEKEAIKSGKVTCDQMKEIMKYDNNPRLIDVREADEYAAGHLDNAINIPYGNIVNSLEAMDSIDKTTPIVVYCKSGTRSGKAFESLKQAGYINIYDLGPMSSCN